MTTREERLSRIERDLGGDDDTVLLLRRDDSHHHHRSEGRRNGKHYHNDPECLSLRGGPTPIELTREAAQRKFLGPCLTCVLGETSNYDAPLATGVNARPHTRED